MVLLGDGGGEDKCERFKGNKICMPLQEGSIGQKLFHKGIKTKVTVAGFCRHHQMLRM